MTTADRAAALVSRWVAAYTRRLPAEAAERRRAEIASDLWEQRADGDASRTPAATVALSILRRMSAGVPADLRWRRQQLAAAQGQPGTATGRGLPRAVVRNWWLVLAALLGVFEVVIGIGMAMEGSPGVGAALPGDPGGIVRQGDDHLCWWGAGGAGIARRRRSRVAGDLLVAVGALPVVSWLWVIGPAAIAPLGVLTVIVAATANAASSRGLGRGATTPQAHDRVMLGNVVVFLALVVAYMLMGSSLRGVGVGLVLISLLSYVGFRRWRRNP